MLNHVKFTFSVGETIWAVLQLELNKTNRIVDTKYIIFCSPPCYMIMYVFPRNVTTMLDLCIGECMGINNQHQIMIQRTYPWVSNS